jgi:hypothetical protein
MRHEYEPPITILLTGCRPWPPPGDRGRDCPVCGQGIADGHDGTLCLWCHRTSAKTDRALHASYIAAERRIQSGAAHQALEARLRIKSKPARMRRRRMDAAPAPVLSERQRRGYWQGGTRRFKGNFRDLASTIHACRVWLKEIGQEPDWSLTHDRFGPLPGKREPPRKDAA